MTKKPFIKILYGAKYGTILRKHGTHEKRHSFISRNNTVPEYLVHFNREDILCSLHTMVNVIWVGKHTFMRRFLPLVYLF